jgi:hypothetical protein
MTVMGVKAEVNLNTIVILAGFLATFAGFIANYTTLQNNQVEFRDWQTQHLQVHVGLASDIASLKEADIKSRDDRHDLAFKTGAMEEAIGDIVARISRIVDAGKEQDAKVETQLNMLTTQLALMNQSLQRLEAFNAGPGLLQKQNLPKDLLPPR